METRQSGNLLDRSLLLARFQVVPVKLVASFVAAQPLAQPHATAGAVASNALRRPPRSPVKDSGEGSRAGRTPPACPIRGRSRDDQGPRERTAHWLADPDLDLDDAAEELETAILLATRSS